MITKFSKADGMLTSRPIRYHYKSTMAEKPHELGDFKKARVNGETDNHYLKRFSQVSPLPLTDPHHMVIK